MRAVLLCVLTVTFLVLLKPQAVTGLLIPPGSSTYNVTLPEPVLLATLRYPQGVIVPSGRPSKMYTHTFEDRLCVAWNGVSGSGHLTWTQYVVGTYGGQYELDFDTIISGYIKGFVMHSIDDFTLFLFRDDTLLLENYGRVGTSNDFEVTWTTTLVDAPDAANVEFGINEPLKFANLQYAVYFTSHKPGSDLYVDYLLIVSEEGDIQSNLQQHKCEEAVNGLHSFSTVSEDWQTLCVANCETESPDAGAVLFNGASVTETWGNCGLSEKYAATVGGLYETESGFHFLLSSSDTVGPTFQGHHNIAFVTVGDGLPEIKWLTDAGSEQVSNAELQAWHELFPRMIPFGDDHHDADHFLVGWALQRSAYAPVEQYLVMEMDTEGNICSVPESVEAVSFWGDFSEWFSYPGGDVGWVNIHQSKVPLTDGLTQESANILRIMRIAHPATHSECVIFDSTECLMSEWTEWSVCVEDCGSEQSKRVRSIISPPFLGNQDCPKTVESKSCELPTCPEPISPCTFTQWTAWTPCTADCDGGSKDRNRIHTPTGCTCDEGCANTSLTEYTACNQQDCQAGDCIVSEWGEWSDCSVTCGGGVVTRNRTVFTEPEPEGLACPALSHSVDCNDDPCEPGDCVVSQWTVWSLCVCPTDSQDGQMERVREILVPSDGGEPCPTTFDEMDSCTCDVATTSPLVAGESLPIYFVVIIVIIAVLIGAAIFAAVYFLVLKEKLETSAPTQRV